MNRRKTTISSLAKRGVSGSMVKTINIALLLAAILLSGIGISVGGVTVVAYAQTDSSSNTVTATIQAITGLVAGIAGVIIAIATFIKSKSGDNKIINDVIYWANNAKETDKWVLENQEKLNTVVSVVENLAPEAKKKLADGNAGMQELTANLNSAKDEIDRIYEIVPKTPEGKPVVSTTEKE